MCLPLFDRAPVSRDIDCHSWTKISEFLADAKVFIILSMASRYNKPVLCGRESAHKSRAQGDHGSLDDCMNAIQHISKEEYETISGA